MGQDRTKWDKCPGAKQQDNGDRTGTPPLGKGCPVCPGTDAGCIPWCLVL